MPRFSELKIPQCHSRNAPTTTFLASSVRGHSPMCSHSAATNAKLVCGQDPPIISPIFATGAQRVHQGKVTADRPPVVAPIAPAAPVAPIAPIPVAPIPQGMLCRSVILVWQAKYHAYFKACQSPPCKQMSPLTGKSAKVLTWNGPQRNLLRAASSGQ